MPVRIFERDGAFVLAYMDSFDNTKSLTKLTDLDNNNLLNNIELKDLLKKLNKNYKPVLVVNIAPKLFQLSSLCTIHAIRNKRILDELSKEDFDKDIEEMISYEKYESIYKPNFEFHSLVEEAYSDVERTHTPATFLFKKDKNSDTIKVSEFENIKEKDGKEVVRGTFYEDKEGKCTKVQHWDPLSEGGDMGNIIEIEGRRLPKQCNIKNENTRYGELLSI